MLERLVTLARLQQFAPSAKPELLAAIVAGIPDMERAAINTPLRVQHFLAQLATETGGFRSIDENLNYTTAERLMQVWPSRFRSPGEGLPYLRNPEKLAEKVYGGREDLGNIRPGDGYRYRGGGFIQVTGRANYRRVGHEDDPETLRSPGHGFKATCDFWANREFNEIADRNNVGVLRRAVNGGNNGLDDCRAYFAKASRIFV